MKAAFRETQDLAADALRIAAIVAGRTIWVTLLGGVLSLVALVMGWRLFADCGFSALSSCFLGLVWLGACLLVFPFLYFWAGKRYGINSGIVYLISKRSVFLWRFVFSRWFKYLESKGLVREGRVSGGQQFVEASNRFLRELPGIPWGLRLVLRAVLWVLPFPDAIRETAEEAARQPMTSEEITERLAPRMAAASAELVFDADLYLFWIIAGIQTGIVAMIRIYY